MSARMDHRRLILTLLTCTSLVSLPIRADEAEEDFLDGGVCLDCSVLRDQLRVLEGKSDAFGDGIGLLRKTHRELKSDTNVAQAIGGAYAVLKTAKIALGVKRSACTIAAGWVSDLVSALGTTFSTIVQGGNAGELSWALVVGHVGGETVELAQETYELADFVKNYADMKSDVSSLADDLEETIRKFEAAQQVLTRQGLVVAGQMSQAGCESDSTWLEKLLE